MAYTWTILKARIKTYTDTLYDAIGTASGKIAASISDGDTTHSPDGNSVFDALALKAPIANPSFTGSLTSAGKKAAFGNQYPIYSFFIAGIATYNWIKICDVTFASGLYKGASFKVTAIDATTNYGHTSTAIQYSFIVSAVRSGGVTDGVPGDGSVVGPNTNYVRLVMVSVGVYEIQVRASGAAWRDTTFFCQCLSNAGGTITYVESPVDAVNTSTAYDATPDNDALLDANTTNHGLLVKATAPASGLRNVVAIDNAETVYTNKALFDATVPSTQAYSDAASAGSAMVAARRDHKHAMPAIYALPEATWYHLKLTGTTAAAEGGATDVAHGITSSKIKGVSVIVHHIDNNGVCPGYTYDAGYQYDWSYTATIFRVRNHATNSENIVSRPFTVLLTVDV